MDTFWSDLLQLNNEVRERFLNLERRIRKNEVISGFYEGIYQGICDEPDYFSGIPEFDKKKSRYAKHVRGSVDSVKTCSRWFDIDYYPFQGVKDLKHTYSCNNKFCDGCQSKISQQRYEKFAPVIECLQKTYDVAHIVITVPNCKPHELPYVVPHMFECRKYLMRYLNGSKRVRGVNFDKYGFQGGVSALEITRNEENGTYHPHFHCAFVFKKRSGAFAHGKYVNSYSFDHGDKVHLFNEFEILLQKVWFLRINGIEVNYSNIQELKEGYDVFCERRDNFHEVFKYATKGVIKYDKDVQRVLGRYVDFVFLDYTLYSRRLIQAYGILRGIPVPDEVDQSSEGDLIYEKFIERLRSLESPIEQRELLESLLEEQKSDDIKYISRHNVKALLGDSENG